MQVLIETRMNSLRLNESKAPKKGCLGRLEGVCADFKNPTRNGRLYPLDLWKKVFDDPLFKEALENKTLFGELDHPEDRFEPLVKHACIVMTDYTIDEDKGLIYGGFDILDTPDGKVLRNILDYGSVLGVSSRGQGDIIETVDGERVDEDSYDFACFDVVSTPAVEKARQKVVESMTRKQKESFKESIERQIEEAESAADLNIIRSVVRTSGLNSSDMDTIIESIEDKCKSFVVGETISTEKANDEQTLIESTNSNDSAKTIRDNKKLYKCISGLREQVSAYKHRETRYVDCVKRKDSELDALGKKIDSLKESLKNSEKRNKSLTEQLNNSRINTTNMKKQINTLKESITTTKKQSNKSLLEKEKQLDNMAKRLDEQKLSSRNIISESGNEIKSLKIENESLKKKLRTASNTSDSLNEKLNSSKSDIAVLNEQLENCKETISSLENELSEVKAQHSRDVSSIDNEVNEYSNLLNEAQQKITEKNSTIVELKNSLKTCQEGLNREKDVRTHLEENLRSYQDSYIKRVSDVYGIDPKSIYHSIDNSTEPKQIDKLVESYRKKLDRYSKLGIADNGIADSSYVVESLNNSYDKSEADEQDKLMSLLQTTVKSL